MKGEVIFAGRMIHMMQVLIHEKKQAWMYGKKTWPKNIIAVDVQKNDEIVSEMRSL